MFATIKEAQLQQKIDTLQRELTELRNSVSPSISGYFYLQDAPYVSSKSPLEFKGDIPETFRVLKGCEATAYRNHYTDSVTIEAISHSNDRKGESFVFSMMFADGAAFNTKECIRLCIEKVILKIAISN